MALSKDIAELLECSTDNISLHLKNIYKEQELSKDSTTEDFSVVQKEGARNIKQMGIKELALLAFYASQIKTAFYIKIAVP